MCAWSFVFAMRDVRLWSLRLDVSYPTFLTHFCSFKVQICARSCSLLQFAVLALNRILFSFVRNQSVVSSGLKALFQIWLATKQPAWLSCHKQSRIEQIRESSTQTVSGIIGSLFLKQSSTLLPPLFRDFSFTFFSALFSPSMHFLLPCFSLP